MNQHSATLRTLSLALSSPLAVLAAMAVLALAVPASAQSPCGEEVTVVYGDTLFEIAQRCGTTVEALVTENELIDDPDVLEVGWVIEVPAVDPADEVPDGRGERPTAPPPTAPPGDGTPDAHLVERGDTLAEIAARYEVPIGRLIAINDIADPNLIHVGQRIVLPDGDGERGRRPPLPEPPTAARVAISPTAGAPGTAVTVTASGFPPGASVQVGAGRAQSEYDVLERTEADAEGRVRATVALPAFADPREEWVFVVTTPDHRVRARSERFDVRPGDGTDGDGIDGDGRDGDEEEGAVTVRGTLTAEGTECPAMRTAEGELYTLTGDLGGFGVGDRVEVTGQVARFSICMQGTTLQVRSIEAAE